MRDLRVESFDEWRRSARELLREGVPPSSIAWSEGDTGNLGLDLGFEEFERPPSGHSFSVPKEFLQRAELVACHDSVDTWSLLYRMLWRIAVKNKRGLLKRANDEDVSEFLLLEKAVRRERHKMTAFVRFRKVEGELLGERESYVAWYEPVHDVVRIAAPFFRDRFTTMNWSILTPRTCVHWNGRDLSFSSGVSRDSVPEEDQLEVYWKQYYASTFNPARTNIAMMEREMPRRYWKNLPEAELISELSNGSYGRSAAMQEHVEDSPALRMRKPKGVPDGREKVSCRSPEEITLKARGCGIGALRELAEGCQACSLCFRATQTVFGVGPENVRLVVVGEQPGDAEDIAGQPFVGPAGQLLRASMEHVKLDCSEIYMTNAVKHFKWKPLGKHRLHQTPDSREIAACAPWLQAELAILRPEVVLCLGATAARAVLGRAVSVTKERGLIDDPGRPFRIVLSYHPSYLLRLQNPAERSAAEHAFLEDLASVAR